MIKLKDSREMIGAPPFCEHAGSRFLPNALNIPNCGLVLKLARYRVSRALEASLIIFPHFQYFLDHFSKNLKMLFGYKSCIK